MNTYSRVDAAPKSVLRDAFGREIMTLEEMDISRLVESFPNLKVLRCDGTDFLASYRTMGEAAEWVRRERAGLNATYTF